MGEEKNNNGIELKIDYENVDVKDIMDQIKKRKASQPRTSELEHPAQPAYTASQASTLPQPEGSLGRKAKIKKVMLKLFKPIAPLIKFLVLPIHQELKDTIENLHTTNQRIDILERRIDEDFSRVHQELQAIILRLNCVREYTQLIHNLSHNIVVELTKLKIEQENLKLKTRIMEKDFEFLGKREKTLESKVFG
jgi:hypothetical protein